MCWVGAGAVTIRTSAGALISFGLLAPESQGDDDNEDHVPYSPMSQEAAQEEVRRSVSKARPPLPLHTCVSRHTLCTARLAWLGQSNRKASYSVLRRSSARLLIRGCTASAVHMPHQTCSSWQAELSASPCCIGYSSYPRSRAFAAFPAAGAADDGAVRPAGLQPRPPVAPPPLHTVSRRVPGALTCIAPAEGRDEPSRKVCPAGSAHWLRLGQQHLSL